MAAATNEAFYHVDSAEGWWNSGEEGGKGGQIPAKRGYFPVPPTDTKQDVRSKIVLALEAVGVPVEVHHHEVATAGQTEIDLRYGPLTAHGRQHHDLQVPGQERGPAERPDGHLYAQAAVWGQRQRHARPPEPVERRRATSFSTRRAMPSSRTRPSTTSAACSSTRPRCWPLCAPTTNSYRRLVPGFEAPVNLAYSQRNRSAVCRIPVYSKSPKAKRVEFRAPGPGRQPVPLLCRAA